MPALALTDRNNLYGAIEFYKMCEKKEIKPVIGVDLDVHIVNTDAHLILLAENNEGYKNLMKLVSAAHLATPGAPRATEEMLAAHHEGLIVLVPESALAAGGRLLCEVLTRIFGKGNVFARLGWNGGREGQERVSAIAHGFGLPLMAGDGVYYLDPEDREPRDIVRRVADPQAPADGKDRGFASPATIEERYRAFPAALIATEEIVARCNLKLSLGSWIFPNFPVPAGATHAEELEKLARSGFARRGLENADEYEKRLVYELGIINGKNFAPYFLAVADLLQHAREEGILTTTRGSAAGSLVSYLTGITNIDPIEYKLPFERFLNPLRPKAPDIDMDIADDRRGELVEYARKKYGATCVAQIGTFGTMMARAAVRDVARALGYPYGVGDRIAKLIPFGSQGFPMTIDHALEIEEDLKKLYQGDMDAETIINVAKRIEGNARHISVHAAGVVIAPGPVTDYSPVQYDPDGKVIITQYDMYALADEYGGVGLLKFDFLGLKNLSVLADAVARVKVRTGDVIDIENIPLDEQKVFAMLGRGETEGVFQLGGGGMTRYLKELEPSSIHDINAMVALYRPGPMESIPAYIERKKNPSRVTYLDPRMKTILDRSYGIITYQDDVLLIAIEIAGYTWLEADALRKAMGKKIPIEMEAQKEKFIDGCVGIGNLTVSKAEAIWKLIEPFAAYGFNKGHAASYGKVAYQTAYMKALYPADYMAALMTADSGNIEQIASHVGECVRQGIKVMPPDVNESFETFTVASEKVIRFGLNSIKNFGDGAAKAIIDERASGGAFASLGDFASRVGSAHINRRAVESLIKAGALDRWGDRADMLVKMDGIVAAQGARADSNENQGALFAVSTTAPVIDIKQEDATPLGDKLEWEKELLGMYVSGHPTDRFKDALAKYQGSIHAARIEDRNGFPMVVGGVVDTAKTILTKKGERMGFFTLADRDGSIEAVAFPRTYHEHKDALTPGAYVLIKGKVSHRNGEPSILIDAVKKLG
jgi:DNA polymerase-3 subunit alpha